MTSLDFHIKKLVITVFWLIPGGWLALLLMLHAAVPPKYFKYIYFKKHFKLLVIYFYCPLLVFFCVECFTCVFNKY